MTAKVPNNTHKKSDNDEHMLPSIKLAREHFAKDIGIRCGLFKKDGSPSKVTQTAAVIGAMLHPLTELKSRIIASRLMTEDQREIGQKSILQDMQMMCDGDKPPTVALLDPEEDEDGDEFDKESPRKNAM